MYRFTTEDKKYTSWKITEFLTNHVWTHESCSSSSSSSSAISSSPCPFQKFNPIENKLFHNDIFTLEKQVNDYDMSIQNITILQSPTRSAPHIPAVLILHRNITYGRQIKQNTGQRDGKLLYQCIPDDPKIPSFLVPYEIKKIGVSKLLINQYVTIQFQDWEGKHPHGVLVQTIGPVNELPNFYEYQLYCKGLQQSILKFQKQTSKTLDQLLKKNKTWVQQVREKFPNVEDRTNDETIMTIDPLHSQDFDDGFGIHEIHPATTTTAHRTFLLSIYIANVSLMLETLDLWMHFTERVSTIYLPNKKYTMLPSVLSDQLCSLQENQPRLALAMDIRFTMTASTTTSSPMIEIEDISYKNVLIKVKKNYVYEDPALLREKNYQLLLEITRAYCFAGAGGGACCTDTTSCTNTPEPYLRQIQDSHDVVAFWMIFMNHRCAQSFLSYQNGIFRSVIQKEERKDTQEKPPSAQAPAPFPSNLEHVPEQVANQLKILQSYSGKYVNGDDEREETLSTLRHEILKMDAYVHITSPIRRLVDLLNMIQLQRNLKLNDFSPSAIQFYETWKEKINVINLQMKNTRKVQNECQLLELCVNHPDVMERKYEGYVFEKKPSHRFQETGLYEYNVYLPELKLCSKLFSSHDFREYECKTFQLYLFHNEEKFKKKIRLSLVE